MRPQNWLYTIPLRLRSLFPRRRVGQELNEERSSTSSAKSRKASPMGFPQKRRGTRLNISSPLYPEIQVLE
jgi:hypothetical protein